jgi:hypothetical protein
LDFLVKPLTSFFNIIHGGVTSIGITNLSLAYFLDIFIFTAIIKFLILPLTIKQTKSTVKMTEMQPKLKELQERYKNDPQKLQQKQMELYKEYAFDMTNKNMTGHWIGTFKRTANGGTRIVFTEEIQIKNPVMNVIAYLFMNLYKMQQVYIKDLKKKLGET